MKEVKIRLATLEDIPFLVDTIIEAEKSGTSILTYTTIFGLEEIEARRYIRKMLEEEIDGCELSVSGFILAEKDGKIIGSLSGWLEAAEGVPSSVLKGNLLSYILPSSCLSRARSLNSIIGDLHIENKRGTIQIGLVYVTLEARGQGLVSILINYLINLMIERYHYVNEAYIQVFGNNLPAIRAYERAGFKVILTKSTILPETRRYMPDITKVLMKKLF